MNSLFDSGQDYITRIHLWFGSKQLAGKEDCLIVSFRARFGNLSCKQICCIGYMYNVLMYTAPNSLFLPFQICALLGWNLCGHFFG